MRYLPRNIDSGAKYCIFGTTKTTKKYGFSVCFLYGNFFFFSFSLTNAICFFVNSGDGGDIVILF